MKTPIRSAYLDLFPSNLFFKKLTLGSIIEMDEVNKTLPELSSFVLPGGSEINVWFHLARTVCRRAERRCVTLSKQNKIDTNVVPYLNRLSDHLFVFSRWYPHLIGCSENLWNPKL